MREKNVDSIYVNYNLWKKNLHFVFSFLLLLFYFSVVFVLQLKELSNYIIDIILFRIANLKSSNFYRLLFFNFYSNTFTYYRVQRFNLYQSFNELFEIFFCKKKNNSNTSFWCLFSSSIRM